MKYRDLSKKKKKAVKIEHFSWRIFNIFSNFCFKTDCVYMLEPHCYAPNFEEVEGAYWFGSVRAVQ